MKKIINSNLEFHLNYQHLFIFCVFSNQNCYRNFNQCRQNGEKMEAKIWFMQICLSFFNVIWICEQPWKLNKRITKGNWFKIHENAIIRSLLNPNDSIWLKVIRFGFDCSPLLLHSFKEKKIDWRNHKCLHRVTFHL